MPPALYALALATFAIGTTEFVIVGLIPGIEADLNVSISTVGLLVSLYALEFSRDPVHKHADVDGPRGRVE